MKQIKFAIATLLTFFSLYTALATTHQSSIENVSALVKKAVAGDTIVIENGIYSDVKLLVAGSGAEGKPIVIMARTDGGVVITGESYLRISGSWLTVCGLHFRDGFSPVGTIIEYRNGSKHAFNCRVTGCVIEGFNPPKRNIKGNWIQLYGQNNRFDHNSVMGKLNEGVTITAVLDGVENQRHRIDNNYFGPRSVYGSNGAETLRTGNSFTSRVRSQIVVENNYFDRCSGEVELLSIKSTGNIIRGNTIFECEGGIALRHGTDNVVEGNLIIGNGKPNTGGVRIVDGGHRILNNYFVGLVGERSFAPLALMNGVPNSPEYRYHQVKNVEILNNTFVDCSDILFGLGSDFERVEAPEEVRFEDNLISNPNAEGAFHSFDEITGIIFNKNRVMLSKGATIPDGFVAVGSNGNKKPVTVQKNECGALWFKYVEREQRALSGRVIGVEAGANSLIDVLLKSSPGDIVELVEAKEYWNDAPVVVPHYVVLRTGGALMSKPTLRYNGRGGEPMIEIANGGHLDISGIMFNGIPQEQLRDPKGFINTAADMVEDYTLWVDNCDFTQFNRSGTYAISCTHGAFAKWIKVTNSRFFDLPWDAIVLNRELDLYGRYNVESVKIENCTFANICGVGINISRLGYDESTAGPYVDIDHCVFYNVFNREQGSVIDLTGVQKINVTNCSFEKSGQGGASIRLNEMQTDRVNISRCNLWESGRIYTFWGTGVQDDQTKFRPIYRSLSEFDLRQADSSQLKGAATDGLDIGLK